MKGRRWDVELLISSRSTNMFSRSPKQRTQLNITIVDGCCDGRSLDKLHNKTYLQLN